jgi:hypothetical protein
MMQGQAGTAWTQSESILVCWWGSFWPVVWAMFLTGEYWRTIDERHRLMLPPELAQEYRTTTVA